MTEQIRLTHKAVIDRLKEDPAPWDVLDGNVQLQYIPDKDYVVVYPYTPTAKITRVCGAPDQLTYLWNTVVVSRTGAGCISLAAHIEARFAGWVSPYGRAVQVAQSGRVIRDAAISSGTRYSLTFEHRIRFTRGG